MTVGKWNYDTHEYEPYDDRLPAGSRIVMNWDGKKGSTIVNCAECGFPKDYGDCYTSNTIHALPFGFGFPVCESCYDIEWAEERRHRNE